MLCAYLPLQLTDLPLQLPYPVPLPARLPPLPRHCLLCHNLAHLRDLLLHQPYLRLVPHALLLLLPLQVSHLRG
jgi:hypothetical protein